MNKKATDRPVRPSLDQLLTSYDQLAPYSGRPFRLWPPLRTSWTVGPAIPRWYDRRPADVGVDRSGRSVGSVGGDDEVTIA